MNTHRKLLQAAVLTVALAGAIGPAFAGEVDVSAAARSAESRVSQPVPSSYALHAALVRAPAAPRR